MSRKSMGRLSSRVVGSGAPLGWRQMLLGFLFACLMADLGIAQSSKTAVVAARALLAADAAHPGSSLKVAVVAEVTPGYHINDHKPTLDYLIPTEVRLEAKDLSIDKVVYPKGESKKFEFSDTPLSVYEGTFVVAAVVKVDRAVRPGTYTMKGKLSYQACNDHACLPPASIPLSLTVKVVPSSVSLKPLNADVFAKVQLD